MMLIFCRSVAGQAVVQPPFCPYQQPHHCSSCVQDADLTQEKFVGTPFWDLFEMPFAEAERPWEACQVGDHPILNRDP